MAEGEQPAAGSVSDGSAGPTLMEPGAPEQPPAAVGDAPPPPPAPAPPLQAELEMVTMERDDYRQRLTTVEAELAALTDVSPDANTINKLQQDNEHLRKTLRKATDMLREKITTINVQEKKNAAMTQQIKTLKEVLQVTRDLLNIRNLEVEQLQKNVDSMEERIDDNRRRQSAMIKQMEQATKINGELRNEYETQLKIFQSLKERYEEKVTALTNLAKARQRSHSESSEKFEDAPETVDAPGSVNEVDSTTAINTDSVSQIAIPESSSAPNIPTPETAPEISNPPEAAPEISNPPEAAPEISNPPEAAPEISNPPEAAPEISNPSEAAPEISNPSEAAPEISNPPEAAPEISNAPETANVS